MLYLALRGKILPTETRKRPAKTQAKTGNRYRSYTIFSLAQFRKSHIFAKLSEG